MQTKSKIFFRSIIALMLISAVAVIINVSSGNSSAIAHGDGTNCGNVTNQDVIVYLTARGYTVYSVWNISGSCDKMADTQNCYHTRVHIANNSIIGFEDLPEYTCGD